MCGVSHLLSTQSQTSSLLHSPQKRMNLTKTLRKVPVDINLDRQGAAYEDKHQVQPKYDDEDMWVRYTGSGCTGDIDAQDLQGCNLTCAINVIVCQPVGVYMGSPASHASITLDPIRVGPRRQSADRCKQQFSRRRSSSNSNSKRRITVCGLSQGSICRVTARTAFVCA